MLFLTPPQNTPPRGGVFWGSFLEKIDKAWRARQPGRRRSGTIRVASPQATWHKPVNIESNEQKEHSEKFYYIIFVVIAS